MLDTIRRVKLPTRLTAYITIIGLTALLSWRFEGEIALNIGVATVLTLVFEAVVYHYSQLVIALIITAQLFIISMFSYIMYGILVEFTGSPNFALTLIIALQLIGMSGIFVSTITAYFIAKGKIWVTLTLSFIAYDVVFIWVVANNPTMSYLITAMIAIIAQAVVLLVRVIFPLRRKETFKPEDVPSSAKISAIQDNIRKLLENNYAHVPSNSKISGFSFVNENHVFYVVPLNPTRHLKVSKNELILDDVPVTGMLELTLKETSQLRKEHKLGSKQVIPVIYVKNNNLLGAFTSLKVFSRERPDRMLGSVFVTTPGGFKILLKKKQADVSSKLTISQVNRVLAPTK